MAELKIPGIELEYAFSISMTFAERIDFIGPRRGKGYVPPASGLVYGPLLNGRVVPYSGADFAIFKSIPEGIKANTHYMLQAARVSDFTAFMYLGELVEFGQTATLFTTPRDKRTQAYITGRFG